MQHSQSTRSTMTEYDRQMAEKRERIVEDPEAYYAAAHKAAYTEEWRRVLRPWTKNRPRPT